MESPMAFKDILLTLTSYPDPTPASVAEDAVAIASTFGAHLAAVACEVHVEVPGHFLSGSIANIPGLIAGEPKKAGRTPKNCWPLSMQRQPRPASLTKPIWRNAPPMLRRIC